MLNKIILAGRLVQEPIIRILPSGVGMAEFTLAWNRSFKVKDEWRQETGFFDCKAYGKLANQIGERLNKGDLVFVEGRLVQERWTGKEGKMQSRVRVLVERVKKITSPTPQEPVQEESINTEEETIEPETSF